MYSRFEEILKLKNLKASDVSKATGISSSTFTDWKKGRYTPKYEKLQKIAAFLQVPIYYLQEEDADIQLDQETAISDMSAFKAYIKNLGWSVQSNARSTYTISNGEISVSISEDKFDAFEHDIRNKCVEKILGFVAESMSSVSASLFAAHQNESPDAGDSDFPEDDLSKLEDGK